MKRKKIFHHGIFLPGKTGEIAGESKRKASVGFDTTAGVQAGDLLTGGPVTAPDSTSGAGSKYGVFGLGKGNLGGGPKKKK